MKELLSKKDAYNGKIIANLFRSKMTHFWNVDNYNIMAHDDDELGRQIVNQIGHKLWYFNLYNNKDLENTIIGNSKKT